MKDNGKAFDNVASRARLTKASDEATRIRRRIDRLDASLVDALSARLTDLDAALMHTREALRAVVDVRAMRGRVR